MKKKNAKHFLYLVQASADLAEEHLKLNTANSDVLIYTFDREIKRPGFLYKPNTMWAEGRNILIDAAKKCIISVTSWTRR